MSWQQSHLPLLSGLPSSGCLPHCLPACSSSSPGLYVLWSLQVPSLTRESSRALPIPAYYTPGICLSPPVCFSIFIITSSPPSLSSVSLGMEAAGGRNGACLVYFRVPSAQHRAGMCSTNPERMNKWMSWNSHTCKTQGHLDSLFFHCTELICAQWNSSQP